MAVTLRLHRTPVEHDLDEETEIGPRRAVPWGVAEPPELVDDDEPTYDDDTWWHRD